MRGWGRRGRTRPLTMPRLRERRAWGLAEVDAGASEMPSGPLGLESLPPIVEVEGWNAVQRAV
jgi:hypothetical protein